MFSYILLSNESTIFSLLCSGTVYIVSTHCTCTSFSFDCCFQSTSKPAVANSSPRFYNNNSDIPSAAINERVQSLLSIFARLFALLVLFRFLLGLLGIYIRWCRAFLHGLIHGCWLLLAQTFLFLSGWFVDYQHIGIGVCKLRVFLFLFFPCLPW